VDETLKAGAHAQRANCYTISPIHNLDSYVNLAKRIEALGVNSLCIKDMAGIMSPKEAFDIISAIKKAVKVPVVLHTHSTTGLAFMTYLKAAEAGCDVIDTAIACMSGGTAQPATETLAYALKELGFETGLDETVLKEINDFFKPLRDKFLSDGLLDPYVLSTDTDALVYQIPGGMLSNLISQLKAQNGMDKFEAVLRETPKVRAELGYPPLVTPMSQMVGAQAVSNVLSGERYKNISNEIRSYVRGEYGTSPGEIDADIITKVLGDEKPVAGRYADTLAPEFEKTKKELGAVAESDEDVLSHIVFPQVADKFFKWRRENRENTHSYKIVKL
jgi:oxaloacetate decarboxylase alpha subunit